MKKISIWRLSILIVALSLIDLNLARASNDCVILLHGLARTKSSMKKMEKALLKNGYTVINDGYKSRDYTVEVLAEKYIPPAVDKCAINEHGRIHFVTHSLGGILVRYYLSRYEIPNLGRIVMLSPPNKGSEVVDKLSNTPGFKLINGKAGYQLGTDSNSVPLKLGPAVYDVGIITGDKSINLILSSIIPGKDDGKVSTQSAKLEGMKDYLVVGHTHPFIMNSQKVIYQSLYFLKEGKFKK